VSSARSAYNWVKSWLESLWMWNPGTKDPPKFLGSVSVSQDRIQRPPTFLQALTSPLTTNAWKKARPKHDGIGAPRIRAFLHVQLVPTVPCKKEKGKTRAGCDDPRWKGKSVMIQPIVGVSKVFDCSLYDCIYCPTEIELHVWFSLSLYVSSNRIIQHEAILSILRHVCVSFYVVLGCFRTDSLVPMLMNRDETSVPRMPSYTVWSWKHVQTIQCYELPASSSFSVHSVSGMKLLSLKFLFSPGYFSTVHIWIYSRYLWTRWHKKGKMYSPWKEQMTEEILLRFPQLLISVRQPCIFQYYEHHCLHFRWVRMLHSSGFFIT
jgi:hypothetical protein